MAGGFGHALQGFGAALQGDSGFFERERVRAQQEEERKAKEAQEMSLKRAQAAATDLMGARTLIRAGDIEGALALSDNRIESIEQLDGDPSHTRRIRDFLAAGDVDSATREIDKHILRAQAVGLLPPDDQEADKDPANVRETKWFLKQDKKTQDTHMGLKREADPTFAERLEFLRGKGDIEVDVAGREVTSKRISDREQGYIDSGIDAADSMGSIQRAINLLDEVKTGGFNSVALKANQMFGVESANEGELSNALGQAVLTNLKPIFGSAFTAQEAQKLEDISANFGKSPETNRRLLERQLAITGRAARRALAAAKKSGDSFTASEIQKAIDAMDDVKSAGEKPAPSGSVLRYNPQTGEFE